MTNFNELMTSLTPEEEEEITRYLKYRRKIRNRGYQPIITPVKSSSNNNSLVILNEDTSLEKVIAELLNLETLTILEKQDPLIKAKIRGIEACQKMLNYQGTSWTSNQVAEYLDITVQAVSKKRQKNQILGLRLGKHGYRFPSWQFRNGTILPGLTDVLDVLNRNSVPDWDKLRFMISEDYHLNGKTPITCLLSGQVELVKSAAAVYGVQSAA